MPCDDCSRAEGCPPCVNEPSSQDEPKGLCHCGHTRNTHPFLGAGYPCVNQGCDCRAFRAQPVPIVINNRCKCSHDRFRHCYDMVDGPCSKSDCDCKTYAPVTVETVELPEPCRWPDCLSEEQQQALADEVTRQMAGEDPSPPIPDQRSICGCVEAPERQVGPGPEHVCERYFCPAAGEVESACHGGFDVCCSRPELHEPIEMCDCGHPLFEHNVYGCEDDCACEKLPPRKAVPPSQPERRPPLSVAYSVAGGHAYEVYVPGDASVTAQDGALIITHPDAQVLAITRVAPIKES